MRGYPQLPARFWVKVNKSGPAPAHAPELGPCWLWTGCIVLKYGIAWYRGRATKAHRVAWELTIGPIPDGLKVLHRCDTPACVRTDHLFLGTQAQNVEDMERKGRGRKAVGAQHGRSRLNEDMARRIRASGGESPTLLARALGVSEGAVRAVLRGETWRHV